MKPSYLVAVSISRSGGVTYAREELDGSIDGNHEVKSWKITKDVPDVPEFKAAEALANVCRRMIADICYRSAFGWIAAKDKGPELDAAVTSIREKLDAANAGWSHCKLTASFVRGEIVTNDQEAADALMKELGAFIMDLQEKVEKCDAKGIRQTLTTMRGMDTLLLPDQSKVLQGAVKAARAAATKIVAEVEKKGKEISEVVKELDLSPIDAAAIMFLEVGEARTVQVPAEAGDVDATEIAAPIATNGHVDPISLDDGAKTVEVVTETELAVI